MFHSQGIYTQEESDLLCFVDITLLHLASAFSLKMTYFPNASAYRYKTRFLSFAQLLEGNQTFRGSATALPKSITR